MIASNLAVYVVGTFLGLFYSVWFQNNWYFSLFIPLKKCEKNKKIQEKNLKIRERAALEIFTIFFENFLFFTPF